VPATLVVETDVRGADSSASSARRHHVEERLILLSAGTAERRAQTRDETERLSAAADWGVLARLLESRRLLATLGPRLTALAADSGEAFDAAVAASIASSRLQAGVLELIGARIRAALLDAGINASALKGPQLSSALYGDCGRRPSSDIDLLVGEEQLEHAVAVVRELGYKAPTDRVRKDGLPLLHFALAHEQGELPSVELHWRIHWYESRFARERLLGNGRDWHPQLEDELAALLLFYARDGFIGLRYASDLSAWWDRHGDACPPGAIDEVIGAYPALGPVLTTAAAVSERTVGIPAARLARRAQALSIRERLAARVADPNPQLSRAQFYSEVSLVDCLLSPIKDMRALLARQLAQPEHDGPERARRPWMRALTATLSHAARTLLRHAITLTRIYGPSRTEWSS
jgi:Uncharacterised nucleotidyltransferase